MGGNLFKLGRLPKADYLRLERKVMTYLDEKLPNAYRIPRYYANKADFGDMDIILCAEELPKAWTIFRLEIAKELGITQYQMSGQLFSTVLEDFQVDFFLRSRADFETTYHYLSFNDIGNLIGKIFKRFNLKYGEVGLEYVFRRAEGSYKKDILISKDFQQIYAFLGLDYEKWVAGFESREDMFEWVMASPYFSVTPYYKKDAKLQKRERERKTMQRFYEYLEEKNVQKTYEYAENKEDYLPKIAAHFPDSNLIKQVEEERAKEARANVIKAKYNGRIVMELFPELKGKALGQFMQSFGESLGEDSEQWLYDAQKKDVIQRLKQYFTQYEQNTDQ
jgi:hypothetical protein